MIDAPTKTKLSTAGCETTLLIPAEDSPGIDRWGCHFLSARHTLAFVSFLGFVIMYSLRVNLSVAIVAMVTTTASNTTRNEECPDPDGYSTSKKRQGEFDWDEELQGIVLGSFYYGYILTQIPGGWLTAKIGGKLLFGCGVLFSSVCTLLGPVGARASVYWLIVLRILGGLGEGVTFPAIYAMWGNWAPKLERSKLVGYTYAGVPIGTVVALPVSALLCDSDIFGGWPSSFYFFGTSGCVWFVAWVLLTYDTPANHPRISEEEQTYIEESVGQKEKLKVPWSAMVKSAPIYALCMAHFSFNWGNYTLLACLPMYMDTILKFNMKENGFLSALPYLIMWFVALLSTQMADFLRGNNYVTTKTARKIFNTVGLVMPALFIVIVGYVGCDQVMVIVFLVLSVGMTGFTVPGWTVNHLDIAPKFSGTLMGITNSVANIPGFVSPAIVGYLTNDNNTRQQWLYVFYISAGVYLVGAIAFALFSEGEELHWARGSDQLEKSSRYIVKDEAIPK